MLGHADYRGPLKGLYHCGTGAHPGGGVTGAPGHNAARAILGDHRALFGKDGMHAVTRARSPEPAQVPSSAMAVG